MIALRIVITLLCGAGLYVAQHMLRKTWRAERGELAESSIVEEPHARLFFGIPNALFGCIYFPCLAAAVWLAAFASDTAPGVAAGLNTITLVALAAASATSAFLVVSLLFITRRECPYCWTGHAINLCLLIAVPWLFMWRG